MITSKMHRSPRPHRVLILGSGALRIGQAGEFDYSGTQALKALKEEGLYTCLVNPNIATIQTDRDVANSVYLLPVEPAFVEKVIAQENIDAVLLGFGGQTALNCGIALADAGVFSRYGVTVLGTPISAIKDTEDRARFIQRLDEIGVKTARGCAVTDVASALEAAHAIGYPVILRSAFALGGQGSAMVKDAQECVQAAEVALANAPQILVEECLYGWKELEYEVVRDSADNCITVCNMENVDPMGIHTGDSIVVAPSQTLNDTEYQLLRSLAIKTVRHLGIVGECNIQFALDPQSSDYRVIEVNARLSRSSALASKATGYPLAYVAAKVALGYVLPDIPNAITKVTCAFFEPALDYVVCKMPRWDLQKFEGAEQTIGTEMKSVGEVTAIGRSFAETLQKALRMLEIGVDGLDPQAFDFPELQSALRSPTPRRIFAIAQALDAGMHPEQVAELTRIDGFFINAMARIVSHARDLKANRVLLAERPMSDAVAAVVRQAKCDGFSDRYLATQWGMTEDEVRTLRGRLGIHPGLSHIDTLAAEYPAETGFLYLSYRATASEVQPPARKKVLILGSGCYRIGSSVEFDWCAVNAVQAARELGYETVLVNCNPETVSTDYDVCDRLIFDELSLESVLEIYRQEAPEGVILAMGGQASNNLALKLAACGVNILGTQAASIDCAEDRQKFSTLLDRLSIPQPRWAEVSSLVEVEKVMAWLDGYPVLVRPSYVLSGAGMRVAHNQDELQSFLARAVEVSREHPVVLSKFESEAREFECDAVADSGEVVLWAVSEHLENAGIHSGDATLVCPPQGLSLQIINRARAITELLACALHITGPFNVQLLARDHEVKVIECNLRASRSFPFISKTLGINFIREATRLMLHMPASWSTAPNMLALPYVAVKVPQFSFNRIKGIDPRSGVEMASTGEVGCFGRDVEEALAKAMLATGYRFPSRSIFLDVPSAQALTHLTTELVRFAQNQGVIFTLPTSTRRLAALGLTDPVVRTVADDDTGSGSVDLLRAKGVDLVISIPSDESPSAHQTGRVVRRAAVDWGVPLLTDMHVARYFLAACTQHHVEALEVKPYGAYLEPTPEQNCFNGLPALRRDDGEQVCQGRPPLRLFIRQSFTECGWQEQQVVQSVLDVLQNLNGKPHPFDIVTGSAAHSRDNFRSVFQHETGLAFSPGNFRHHRLSLLRHADAMLVVRTGLSESGAFEVAYNLFKGKNVPMFFAIWRQSPIKTTLLRELHDLGTVVYVDFEHPEELRKPLRNFLSLVAHSTMGAAMASHDARQGLDGVEVWDRVPLVELRLNRTGALRNR